MKKQLETVIIDGVEKVVIYSKTQNGKPHPNGGVFKFYIPLSEYKPRNN